MVEQLAFPSSLRRCEHRLEKAWPTIGDIFPEHPQLRVRRCIGFAGKSIAQKVALRRDARVEVSRRQREHLERVAVRWVFGRLRTRRFQSHESPPTWRRKYLAGPWITCGNT